MLGQSIAHPAMYGPLAALCTELFGTRARYTGASLGYQLAGLGAGIAPVVFASIAGAGTLVISAVIAACCLLTVLSVLALAESHRSDLTDDPVGAVPPATEAIR